MFFLFASCMFDPKGIDIVQTGTIIKNDI